MTYCIVGDGEMQEGQVWEAVEFAAHRELDHFVVLVDYNKMQLDGYLKDICNEYSIKEKLKAFGFDAVEVIGYDVEAVYEALAKAKDNRNNGKPKAIILDTKKGMGYCFGEKADKCHHMNISPEQAEEAIKVVEDRLLQGLTPGGERYAD